jgi:hypothetical protein
MVAVRVMEVPAIEGLPAEPVPLFVTAVVVAINTT